jgi:mono/diheme cytochrome c family protein
VRLLAIFIVAALLISACAPQAPAATQAPLEAGDVARGEVLFTESIDGAPPCSTCHSTDGSALVGPSLLDYATTAATHAGDASIEEYTHASIVQPAAYVVSDFPNAMYNQYGQRLSEQQIADLIAYLLTL